MKSVELGKLGAFKGFIGYGIFGGLLIWIPSRCSSAKLVVAGMEV
jgi:hypothetical protein